MVMVLVSTYICKGDDDDDDIYRDVDKGDDDEDELGFWSCGRRHLLPATVIFWPSNIHIQYHI